MKCVVELFGMRQEYDMPGSFDRDFFIVAAGSLVVFQHLANLVHHGLGRVSIRSREAGQQPGGSHDPGWGLA